MGFHPDDIVRALELTIFSCDKALLLLLHGIDEKRIKQDAKARFQRRSRQTVIHIDSETLPSDNMFAECTQRAHEHYQVNVAVWDFGQHAGRTSGACFWLCLAAGLAESKEGVLTQVLPGHHAACLSLARLRSKGVRACALPSPRRTDLGTRVEALRKYFSAMARLQR